MAVGTYVYICLDPSDAYLGFPRQSIAYIFASKIVGDAHRALKKVVFGS